MLEKLSLKNQNFDCLSVGVIDFKKSQIKTFETEPGLYYDLASLTKPLTLFAVKSQHPDIWQKEYDLLLNHQAGLPDWGRLSKTDWKSVLLNFELKKSPTLYSDFGALRLMVELEKKTGRSLKELCSYFWDEKLIFWRDLKDVKSPITGVRQGKPIRGQVHDDNAYNIGEFCSHAGLFATVTGLGKSLLNLNEENSFVSKMAEKLKKSTDRFCDGWDTPGENSLAGSGHSALTFGHLGFTGTSIWIDGEKEMGHIILTNATKNYWHDREGLNKLRRELGARLWKQKI